MTITTTETMWMLIRLVSRIGQNKCREGLSAVAVEISRSSGSFCIS